MVPTDIRYDGAMSELGQSRHFGRRQNTSGLPSGTDIVRPTRPVRKVPKADMPFIRSPRWRARRIHRYRFPSPQFAVVLAREGAESTLLRKRVKALSIVRFNLMLFCSRYREILRQVDLCNLK
jgi:hypothetical protein